MRYAVLLVLLSKLFFSHIMLSNFFFCFLAAQAYVTTVSFRMFPSTLEIVFSMLGCRFLLPVIGTKTGFAL